MNQDHPPEQQPVWYFLATNKDPCSLPKTGMRFFILAYWSNIWDLGWVMFGFIASYYREGSPVG
jgi:hypothetical protein